MSEAQNDTFLKQNDTLMNEGDVSTNQLQAPENEQQNNVGDSPVKEQQKESVKIDVKDEKEQQKTEDKLDKDDKNKSQELQRSQTKVNKDGKRQRSCLYRFCSGIKKFFTILLVNPVMLIITFVCLTALCILGQYCDWAYLDNKWTSNAAYGTALTLQFINIVSIVVGNYPWLGKIVKYFVGFFLIGFGKILTFGENRAFSRESKPYISVIKFNDGHKEEEIVQKSGGAWRVLSYIICIGWGILFIYASYFAFFIFILVAQIFRFPALLYIYRKNRNDQGICQLVLMIITWMCITQLAQSAGMAVLMLQNNESESIWDTKQYATIINNDYKINADFAHVKNEFGFIIAASLSGLLFMLLPFQLYLYNDKMQKQNVDKLVSMILNQGNNQFKFYLGCSKSQAVNYCKGTTIQFDEKQNKHGKGIYLHRIKLLAEKDIRDPKAKKSEAILELLVDLGNTALVEQEDHELMKSWQNSYDSLFVPRAVLDPLIESHVIKNPKSVVQVLNASDFIKLDEKDQEKLKNLIAVKEAQLSDTENVHPFLEDKIKKARVINLNQAYEIAVLKHYWKNSKKKIPKKKE